MHKQSLRLAPLMGMLLLLLAENTHSTEKVPLALSKIMQEIPSDVLTPDLKKSVSSMIDRDLRRRRDHANTQNRAEWTKIKNRKRWEAFTQERLQRLRQSLGNKVEVNPNKVPFKVMKTIKGDGYHIKNIVYDARTEKVVPANLYVPAKPDSSMPGIILVHSHHRHRMQPELQDMGMTWARNGCVVLVIDQTGYGERRAHPFDSAKDYAKEYKYWRQDYYYRYDSGIQLQLAGESLMGWMIKDLMDGVSVLLAQQGVDSKRIIVLGAVAGGGDPAGILAALDPRIKGAVPFNFGGAQPETRYPLPPDAEKTFNYLGGSYWESTRGLWQSANQGFFHWTIVGSIAPRPLIYAHEFAWDKPNDPVWKRFKTIWGWYDAQDKLAGLQGKGSVRLRPPEATHCTNIGKYHRQFIHPQFRRWFDIDVQPNEEYSNRRTNDELKVWSQKQSNFIDAVNQLGTRQLKQLRKQLASMKVNERRAFLQRAWRERLGNIKPIASPKVTQGKTETKAGIKIERIILQVEQDIHLPMIILSVDKLKKEKSPLVLCLAQGGKEAFLKHRAKEIAQYLQKGMRICLPDLRGTGETRAGTSRGRTSGDGNRSVNLLLYGETMLGQRLRDARTVLQYLRVRKEIDGSNILLWGDSFVEPNATTTNFKVPRGVSGRPRQSEPVGGLLALFLALFEKDVDRVHIHRGLISYQSVLTSPHVYIPHDVVVPWALKAGDLPDIAEVLDVKSVTLKGMVDHLNRPVNREVVSKLYPKATVEE